MRTRHTFTHGLRYAQRRGFGRAGVRVVHLNQPVLVSVDLPRPGDALGNYVIERQVGQGGMAVIYEAFHRTLGKRVAIKMLLPHHLTFPELVHRFQREGEAAARLEHANAVSLLDGGCDARGTPYLVLEYLEGEDLGTVLAREGSLTVERTVDWIVPVVAAIAAAHDLGIVHRDLKPENVFLARKRRQLTPKVLDFGISKTSEAETMKLTRSESLLGTPHYMSPEQAQGAGSADARTDQFAIGVMLYECVTGTCPFEGNSVFAVLAAIVAGDLTPPSKLVPGLDARFEAAVLRALSKEPGQRFPDLRALGAALLPLASPRTRHAYAEELGVLEAGDAPALAARPVELPEPAPPAFTRTPVMAGAAFVLAAAATLSVASKGEDKPESAAKPVADRRTPTPTAPQTVATNATPDQSLIEDIAQPRKPSGLYFARVEAPTLCSTSED